MKGSHKAILLWVLLIMVFLGIWTLLSPDRPPATKIAYSDFLAMVEADRDVEPYVDRVNIVGSDYICTIKDPQAGTTKKMLAEGPPYLPADLVDRLLERKVMVIFENEPSTPTWSGTWSVIVPLVLVVVMFYVFLRKAGANVAISGRALLESIPPPLRHRIRIDADLSGLDASDWVLNQLEDRRAIFTAPKGTPVFIPYAFVTAVWPSNAEGEHTVTLSCALTGVSLQNRVLVERVRRLPA